MVATSGCVPYEQRVLRTCQSLGYSRGTSLMQQCMAQQMANDNANQQMWLGVAGTGATMMQQQPARSPICFTNPSVSGGFTIYCQ